MWTEGGGLKCGSDIQQDSSVVAAKPFSTVDRIQRHITLEPTDRPRVTRLLLGDPLAPRDPRAPVRREVTAGGAIVEQCAFLQAVVERGNVGVDLHVSDGTPLPGGVLEVGVAKNLKREGCVGDLDR